MNLKRYGHACGRTFTNSLKTQYSIVAAGGILQLGPAGVTVTDTSSVEVYDYGAGSWRNGPSLPVTLCDASMIQDNNGGVILIGGYSLALSKSLDTLYRLPHTAAQWELMPQRLKTARFYPIAFLIPDNITNCTP